MSEEKRGETFVIKGEVGPGAPIEFNTFVLGLASTALIHLGEAPHPETGKPETSLELARESLELLSLLRRKTQGNLSLDEERFFDNLLSDLRLRYVSASQR